ncbi:hypothetical protein ACFQS2_07625 [Brachybacterium sp. GCM10030267]|uniref:hypothetical protein n=1 Tax=Brachybacterium sp. GCM10030267 TaxID=3273381 RepID=UPI00361A0CFD
MATELLNASRMNRGTLPPGADADHFIPARHAGLWHIDSAVAESVIGLPADASGQQGEFLVLQSTTGMQMFFPYGCDGASCGYVRKLLDAVTDEWSEWSPWEPTSGDDLTAVAQHEIRRAQFTSLMGGLGLQLMLHPSQLDATGNLSTAQFLEVLDYIAAMRDAGLLVTLSPYEMLLADST